MLGEIVAGYRILSRIGAGGMGEVFVAEHVRIDRRVAIKLLRAEMSSRTDMVARFFAEARATSSIRHPGIVEVLDCDVLPNGRAYIVMELLEGKSLLARMMHDRTFGSDERLALSLTGEIASALEAAHRKHIVHRDLKPDNIFLVVEPGTLKGFPDPPAKDSARQASLRPRDLRASNGFVVKILDFGIAKLLSTEGEGHVGIARTRTGALLGTPIYMSPEQCRGAAAVDWRADIYAMGCILFEMLAGRPPFTYEGFGELISAHITEPPPSLLALQPRITPAVAAFVARLLEKDPARRPQSMEAAGQEIAALLAQVIATSELRARETEPMPTAGAPASPPQRSQTPISAGGARPASGPGHTLVADPLGVDRCAGFAGASTTARSRNRTPRCRGWQPRICMPGARSGAGAARSGRRWRWSAWPAPPRACSPTFGRTSRRLRQRSLVPQSRRRRRHAAGRPRPRRAPCACRSATRRRS